VVWGFKLTAMKVAIPISRPSPFARCAWLGSGVLFAFRAPAPAAAIPRDQWRRLALSLFQHHLLELLWCSGWPSAFGPRPILAYTMPAWRSRSRCCSWGASDGAQAARLALGTAGWPAGLDEIHRIQGAPRGALLSLAPRSAGDRHQPAEEVPVRGAALGLDRLADADRAAYRSTSARCCSRISAAGRRQPGNGVGGGVPTCCWHSLGALAWFKARHQRVGNRVFPQHAW